MRRRWALIVAVLALAAMAATMVLHRLYFAGRYQLDAMYCPNIYDGRELGVQETRAWVKPGSKLKLGDDTFTVLETDEAYVMIATPRELSGFLGDDYLTGTEFVIPRGSILILTEHVTLGEARQYDFHYRAE